MVNGTTLHAKNNAHPPPDNVKQFASMVRALLNKYVPILLLEQIEIDLLKSLKDFCHCTRKCITAVNLRKIATNTLQPQGQPPQQTTTLDSSITSNNDSWHEPTNAP
jgi:hypothetical protein